MTRFCANCGTEVDDHAVFCPTCGQPIDQETEAEMPPAPSWPEPAPRAPQPTHEPADAEEPEPAQEPPPRDDRGWSAEQDPDTAEVTGVVEPQPGPAVEAAPSPATGTPPWRANHRQPASRAPARPAVDLRLTMPVTLSGWLIGGGAVLGAIGAFIAMLDGFGTAIDLLLLISLLAVAASVFLSDRLHLFVQLPVESAGSQELLVGPFLCQDPLVEDQDPVHLLNHEHLVR
ncbi:MAG: zinc-ribbon domain-containing protein, partial [Candidatus Limnocylindria bacterium]